MTEPLVADRLVVVVNQHPDKRLSPNAPLPTSVAAKRGRQRVARNARMNGYDAARIAVIDHAVLEDSGLYYAACGASFPAPLTNLGTGETALGWMTGPVDVEILIGWGVGRGTHDDDGAIGSCKSYRDGIADLFGSSDRRWRTRRVLQSRAAPTHPQGQVSFTFTPRRD